MEDLTDTKELAARSLWIGGVQLVFGVVCLAATVVFWQDWLAQGKLWALWALAMGLFFLGLAGVNFLYPVLEGWLRRSRRGEFLALRLPSLIEGSETLTIPMMGLAFGLPAVVLWIIVVRAPNDSLEQFLAIGSALVSTALGVLLLGIGLHQFYISFSALHLKVEIEREQLLPDQSVRCLIQGRRGRLPAQAIEIYLLCRKRTKTYQGKRSQTQMEVFREDLLYEVEEHELKAEVWQKYLSIRIPTDAVPGRISRTAEDILWDIQARVKLNNLPDFTQYFPLQVLALDLDEDEGETQI
jgi:hypothetical protein